MINHGTRGGYYAHLRQEEARPITCQPCLDAINEYVKAYRAKNGMARNRVLDGIRRKAMATLRDKHREEYDSLVRQYQADAEIEALELEKSLL